MPDTSPSVLLVRLDAIGDALALTPMLAALWERSIPVDIVLSQRNAEAFTALAYRRRLLPADVRPGLYTHALVATEDADGYRIAQRSEAPVRIGFDNGWGKPFKTLWVRSLLTTTLLRSAGLEKRAPHECEVLFQLAETLLNTEVAAVPRDLSVLRPLVVAGEEIRDDRVIFQVTDKWERLGIAFNDVVSCARRLSGYLQSSGTSTIRCIASAQEDIYAAAFEQETGLQVELFTALAPWKNTIANARALVAPDSGAIHVAGMTGTPAVAVFPPMRNFDLQTARWAPWAAPYRIVKAGEEWPHTAIAALQALRVG